MSEQDERRVYSLSDDHYFAWADVEDLVPEAPEIPAEVRPLYLTGGTVEDVDALSIYAFGGDAPEFSEADLSVDATPQEMAEWRAVWASMEEAQQAFRARLKEAQEAYEAAAQEALAGLAEAMKPWAPVEATLKARSAELAATLHAHRTAAKEWKATKQAQEEERLDAIHGPRAIVLYKPKSLSSRNTADHVAKVHLVSCTRRAKKATGGFHMKGWDNDEGLRANEAWHRLTHAEEWVRSGSIHDDQKMRVKFCSFCKPWTVFEEHIEDFPRPRYDGRMSVVLGDIRLTDVPDAWTP